MSNFIFHPTSIEGVFLIDVKNYADERGSFMETYHEEAFQAAGLNYRFVQDNQSSSRKGVLRGLHFQKQYAQAKLVRVLQGEVFDVAVDLREGSKTYGKWVGEVLSGDNRRQLMIPRGFAHGFLVLSDTAVFAYKCDEFYHPEDEGGILWNDPAVGIVWPGNGDYILNEKDRNRPTLFECGFCYSERGKACGEKTE